LAELRTILTHGQSIQEGHRLGASEFAVQGLMMVVEILLLLTELSFTELYSRSIIQLVDALQLVKSTYESLISKVEITNIICGEKTCGSALAVALSNGVVLFPFNRNI
jgi:hypothetical protein